MATRSWESSPSWDIAAPGFCQRRTGQGVGRRRVGRKPARTTQGRSMSAFVDLQLRAPLGHGTVADLHQFLRMGGLSLGGGELLANDGGVQLIGGNRSAGKNGHDIIGDLDEAAVDVVTQQLSAVLDAQLAEA